MDANYDGRISKILLFNLFKRFGYLGKVKGEQQKIIYIYWLCIILIMYMYMYYIYMYKYKYKG